VERLDKIYQEMHKEEVVAPPKPEIPKAEGPSSAITSPAKRDEVIPKKEVTPPAPPAATIKPAEPQRALKRRAAIAKAAQQEDALPQQNILQVMATIFILLVFLVILNVSAGSKSAPNKKRKEFEPRELRKYLNDKNDKSDRDLFG